MDFDDHRVEDFLLKYKAEVPDQGFTRRVMRHLPDRTPWLNRVVNLVACVAFLVLCYVRDGLHAITHVVMKALMTLGYECIYSFSWTWVTGAFGLFLLSVGCSVWYYGFHQED